MSNAELIDKCVGSKIWVVMKGDRGAHMMPFLLGCCHGSLDGLI